jgi:hypothetical protein
LPSDKVIESVFLLIAVIVPVASAAKADVASASPSIAAAMICDFMDISPFAVQLPSGGRS